MQLALGAGFRQALSEHDSTDPARDLGDAGGQRYCAAGHVGQHAEAEGKGEEQERELEAAHVQQAERAEKDAEDSRDPGPEMLGRHVQCMRNA